MCFYIQLQRWLHHADPHLPAQLVLLAAYSVDERPNTVQRSPAAQAPLQALNPGGTSRVAIVKLYAAGGRHISNSNTLECIPGAFAKLVLEVADLSEILERMIDGETKKVAVAAETEPIFD